MYECVYIIYTHSHICICMSVCVRVFVYIYNYKYNCGGRAYAQGQVMCNITVGVELMLRVK